MTEHTHTGLVPGCYRCELNRDEIIDQIVASAPPLTAEQVTAVAAMLRPAGVVYMAPVGVAPPTESGTDGRPVSIGDDGVTEWQPVGKLIQMDFDE